MIKSTNIISCYVSITAGNYNDDQRIKDIYLEQGRLFRSYLWKNGNGLFDLLKQLSYSKYGKDLNLILFQFYVNPLPVELEKIKVIEQYKKKEKSIGIPIIVNNDNFFSKSEVERDDFLKKSILQKLDVLSTVIKSKKLDTNIEQLKIDVKEIMQ